MSERADPFTVVIDANVLVGALTRNLVLSLAGAGFFRPRWSSIILDEFERTYARRFGDDAGASIQRCRVEEAFPEACIVAQAHLVESLELPDPEDRHVLAAAIQTRAAVIVTENTRDFPAVRLEPHDIEAICLDDFLADCIDMAGAEAIAAIRQMRERFERPEIDADTLILKVEALGLSETADLLNQYRDLL